MSALLPTAAAAAAAARAPPHHRHPDTDYPNNDGGTVEDKFERFERWLRENGAYFPEVSRRELRQFDMT